MAGMRDKPEEIALKLRQVEVLQGQGSSIADAVRQIGVTQQTYYRWRDESTENGLWYTTIFALSIGVAALKNFGTLTRELDWRAASRWRFGF